jgi:hypothetical protein
MSNLKLPKMDYATLKALLSVSAGRTIGYATTISWGDSDVIEIHHHGNLIAEISPAGLFVTNAGWDSKTTIDRLRRIMHDNGLPFSVRIRDYSSRLLALHDGEWIEAGDFYPSYFRNDEKKGWEQIQ